MDRGNGPESQQYLFSASSWWNAAVLAHRSSSVITCSYVNVCWYSRLSLRVTRFGTKVDVLISKFDSVPLVFVQLSLLRTYPWTYLHEPNLPTKTKSYPGLVSAGLSTSTSELFWCILLVSLIHNSAVEVVFCSMVLQFDQQKRKGGYIANRDGELMIVVLELAKWEWSLSLCHLQRKQPPDHGDHVCNMKRSIPVREPCRWTVWSVDIWRLPVGFDARWMRKWGLLM